jgi:hypothetical protein
VLRLIFSLEEISISYNGRTHKSFASSLRREARGGKELLALN